MATIKSPPIMMGMLLSAGFPFAQAFLGHASAAARTRTLMAAVLREYLFHVLNVSGVTWNTLPTSVCGAARGRILGVLRSKRKFRFYLQGIYLQKVAKLTLHISLFCITLPQLLCADLASPYRQTSDLLRSFLLSQSDLFPLQEVSPPKILIPCGTRQ